MKRTLLRLAVALLLAASATAGGVAVASVASVASADDQDCC
ncbi:hypothetical protein [Streptosporangium pseudovulgare]|nr:hypothetical protein [Streptosporangium pseudovulgare]